MKTPACLRAVAAWLVLFVPAWSQTVNISTWKLDQRDGTAVEASDAVVTATAAPYVPSRGRYRQNLTPGQAVALSDPASAIDVSVRLRGYHSVVIPDLSVGPGRDHSLHVQLLSIQIPVDAPECFALKAQYERLFRKTEQFARPGMSRDDVQREARLLYSDGILSLPNPNRPLGIQPQVTQRMLKRMQDEEENGRNNRYSELGNMMDGLLNVFGMEPMEEYVPSTWTSEFEPFPGTNPRDLRAAVELTGTTGRHGNRDLFDIDFSQDDEGNTVIQGKWQQEQRMGPPLQGGFRWVLGEDGRSFEGVRWRDDDRNLKRSWNGTAEKIPSDYYDSDQ
jgi:hypothetical protein